MYRKKTAYEESLSVFSLGARASTVKARKARLARANQFSQCGVHSVQVAPSPRIHNRATSRIPTTTTPAGYFMSPSLFS